MFRLATVLFFISTSAFAHGNLQLISCENVADGIKLLGTKTEVPNKLDIAVNIKTEPAQKSKSVQMNFKDSLDGDKIIENISFDLTDKSKVHLAIPEDYSIKVRPGKGSLEKGKDKNDFTCMVTYE